MSHRRDAPDGEGERITDLSAEAVHQASGGQQSQSVRSVKGGYDIAVLQFVPAQCLLQILGENSQHLPVDIVDGGGKEKQTTNHPSIVTDARVHRGYSGCGLSRQRSWCGGDDFFVHGFWLRELGFGAPGFSGSS